MNNKTYQSRAFKWDRPNDKDYPNKAIRILLEDATGKIVHTRPATDEEVRCVMLFEATAWASPGAATPAHQYDPEPISNRLYSSGVTREQIGIYGMTAAQDKSGKPE